MGVNSLWSLLEPAARPVELHHATNKILAVDISIWLQQIVKGMRTPQGDMIPNAHIVGMFARILKLLHYHIKPVFVFDGGTPALKELVLKGRRKRRHAGEEDLERTKRRLLESKLKRYALGDNDAIASIRPSRSKKPDMFALPQPAGAQAARPRAKATKRKGKGAANPLDLDEIGALGAEAGTGGAKDGGAGALAGGLGEGQGLYLGGGAAAGAVQVQDSSSDEDAGGASYVSLANVDVQSDTFAALPFELQHEIVLDLQDLEKHKSRRGTVISKSSEEGFSEDQITGLVRKNLLNRKLEEVRKKLMTVDAGDGMTAHRIVSEANTLYLLEKKPESHEGAGTANGAGAGDAGAGDFAGEGADPELAAAIEASLQSHRPPAGTQASSPLTVAALKKLDERRRGARVHPRGTGTRAGQASATSAAGAAGAAGATTPGASAASTAGATGMAAHATAGGDAGDAGDADDESDESLSFGASSNSDDDDAMSVSSAERGVKNVSTGGAVQAAVGEDAELAAAIEASLQSHRAPAAHDAASVPRDAAAAPTRDAGAATAVDFPATAANVRLVAERSGGTRSGISAAATAATPTTSAQHGAAEDGDDSDANASVSSSDSDQPDANAEARGVRSLGPGEPHSEVAPVGACQEAPFGVGAGSVGQGASAQASATTPVADAGSAAPARLSTPGAAPLSTGTAAAATKPPSADAAVPTAAQAVHVVLDSSESGDDNDDDDLISVHGSPQRPASEGGRRSVGSLASALDPREVEEMIRAQEEWDSQEKVKAQVERDAQEAVEAQEAADDDHHHQLQLQTEQQQQQQQQQQHEDEGDLEAREVQEAMEACAEDARPLVSDRVEDDELLTHAGRAQAVTVLESEERALHTTQRRAAVAAAGLSSEILTDVQILLQLFGLPFITAPMEAEAQCACLEEEGHTQGTITDDSDIFLFGAKVVYRRVCSRTKGPEMYQAGEVASVLGLDRARLVQLAYLLGSDYTKGVTNIGIVTAMEVMANFPGETMLQDFKAWVDSTEAVDATPEMKKLGRLLKHGKRPISLPDSFPDPRVETAYTKPQVEKSSTAFHWGTPDVEAIRDFTESKLGWHHDHTDSQLLPVLKRMEAKQKQQPGISAFFGPSFTTSRAADRAKMRPKVQKAVERVKEWDAATGGGGKHP